MTLYGPISSWPRQDERQDKSQRGLGLIELLIALALSSILSLALFEVFKISRASFEQVLDANEMLDRAQFSFSLLQDAINMANFWGGAAVEDLDLISTQLTAYPGNCDSEWVLNFEQGLQGFDGRERASDIASLPEGCLSDDYVPNSDILVIRRASTHDLIPEQKLNSKYYKQRFIVRAGVDVGAVIFQGMHAQQARKLIPYSSSVTNRLIGIDMFYLEYCENEGLCDGSGVGLSRYTLSGNRFVKQRLVNGLAQLQFEYGLDLDSDGLVEQYATANNVMDWQRVRSVRVFALLKGAHSSRFYSVREHEIPLGDSFIFSLPDQGSTYQYRKFQSEFSLNNS